MPQFCENLGDLVLSDWFHDTISRQESAKLLANKNQGCFLIRVSATSGNELVVSFNGSNSTVNHMRIGKPPFQWRNFKILNGETGTFKSLKKFLESFKTVLLYPCPKSEEGQDSSGYAALYISMNEDDEDSYEEDGEFALMDKSTSDKIMSKLTKETQMNMQEFSEYLEKNLSKEISNHEVVRFSESLVKDRAFTIFKLKGVDVPTLTTANNKNSFFQALCLWWYRSDLLPLVQQKKTEVKVWMQKKGDTFKLPNRNSLSSQFLISDPQKRSWEQFCDNFNSKENSEFPNMVTLYAASQQMKANIVILTDSEDQKNIHLIQKKNAKRTIALAMVCGKYVIPLLPTIKAEEIETAWKKQNKITKI